MKFLKLILLFCLFSLTVYANESDKKTYPLSNAIIKVRPFNSIPNDQFGKLVQKGYSLFVDSQQMKKKYVGNDLNCVNCHLAAGTKADSAPLWAAFMAFPSYRKKNNKVNTYEERIQGCFRYSMNGKPPKKGAPELVALSAFSYWMLMGGILDHLGFKDQPVPEVDKKYLLQGGALEDFPLPKEIQNKINKKELARLPGRGYVKIPRPKAPENLKRGEKVYLSKCSTCHGKDGQGVYGKDGRAYIPPLWGLNSYNWGAGMHKVSKLAAFVYKNMPLVKVKGLNIQDSWDVATYVNNHMRPEDPRFKGDFQETAKKYHKHKGYYLLIHQKKEK